MGQVRISRSTLGASSDKVRASSKNVGASRSKFEASSKQVGVSRSKSEQVREPRASRSSQNNSKQFDQVGASRTTQVWTKSGNFAVKSDQSRSKSNYCNQNESEPAAPSRSRGSRSRKSEQVGAIKTGWGGGTTGYWQPQPLPPTRTPPFCWYKRRR